MRRGEGIWGAACAGGGSGDYCALHFFCVFLLHAAMPYLGTAAALVVCPPPRVIFVKTPSSTAAQCVGGRLRRRRDALLFFLGPPPSRRSCLGGGGRATAFLLPLFFDRSSATAGFSGRVAWSSGCGGARRRPQRRRPGGAGVPAAPPWKPGWRRGARRCSGKRGGSSGGSATAVRWQRAMLCPPLRPPRIPPSPPNRGRGAGVWAMAAPAGGHGGYSRWRHGARRAAALGCGQTVSGGRNPHAPSQPRPTLPPPGRSPPP